MSYLNHDFISHVSLKGFVVSVNHDFKDFKAYRRN